MRCFSASIVTQHKAHTLGSKVAKLSKSGEGFPSISPSTATVTAACCSPANKFFTPAPPHMAVRVCLYHHFLVLGFGSGQP
jgi:hypothetical protein